MAVTVRRRFSIQRLHSLGKKFKSCEKPLFDGSPIVMPRCAKTFKKKASIVHGPVCEGGFPRRTTVGLEVYKIVGTRLYIKIYVVRQNLCIDLGRF